MKHQQARRGWAGFGRGIIRVVLGLVLAGWTGVEAAAHEGEPVDFRVRFGTSGLQRTITVDWDHAGTLEYATTLGRWTKSTNVATLLRDGRRSVTFEYPGISFPRQMFFRLRLPEDPENEHRHVFEVTDPFLPGLTVQPADPSWAINRPQPVYRIRLHLVRCADTLGANRVALQTNEFQQYVDMANTIFFRSGIVFDWNPVTDVEDVNNTALNSEATLLVPASSLNDPAKPPVEGVDYTKTNSVIARRLLAESRKGKLVVYSTRFGSLTEDEFAWDGTNRWRLKVLNGGYSSWASTYVVLPGTLQGLHLLAHEIGHYLNNPHTFVNIDWDGDNVDSELSDVRSYLKYLLEDGIVAPAKIYSRMDGDGYWVRDTPPDVGTRFLKELNGGEPCATNPVSSVTVTVPSTGVYPGTYTFNFMPDRLNVQSYFRCPELGPMRQSPDQIARTRDALENRHRHHLIARHMGSITGTQLVETDSWESGTASSIDLQLVRVRHDQFALLRRRTSDNTYQLLSFSVDEAGALTLRGSISGLPCEQAKMENMGLGLVAVAYTTPERRPALAVFRVSDTGTWSALDSWGWLQTDVREIDLARFGRLNLGLACRTSAAADNTHIYSFTVNADGSIGWQSMNEVGTSTAIALASGGPRHLAAARRDAAGNLLLETWGLTEEREIGATLERLDAASAGAIDRPAVLSLDSDRLVTPVATGAGDLKFIDWKVDPDGQLVRNGNGSTVTGLSWWESSRFSTDLIAVAARTSSGGMAARLFEAKPDGTFVQRQSNTGQLLLNSPSARPVAILIRDQHMAVARLNADGFPEVRIYSAPF